MEPPAIGKAQQMVRLINHNLNQRNDLEIFFWRKVPSSWAAGKACGPPLACFSSLLPLAALDGRASVGLPGAVLSISIGCMWWGFQLLCVPTRPFSSAPTRNRLTQASRTRPGAGGASSRRSPRYSADQGRRASSPALS